MVRKKKLKKKKKKKKKKTDERKRKKKRRINKKHKVVHIVSRVKSYVFIESFGIKSRIMKTKKNHLLSFW